MSRPRPRSAAAFVEWLDRQNKWLVALAATALHGVLYLIGNHLPLFPARELPMTAADRAIPFIPQTAWIYWSDYGLVVLAFQVCRGRGSTARFVAAIVTLVTTGVLIHLLFPTVYPRELFPIDASVDPLTRTALEQFRRVDTPASCLPSLHVAACYLATFAAWSHASRARFALLAWATLVSISTLTLKQHYLIDLATGIALAAGIWVLFYRPGPFSPSASTSTSREDRI